MGWWFGAPVVLRFESGTTKWYQSLFIFSEPNRNPPKQPKPSMNHEMSVWIFGKKATVKQVSGKGNWTKIHDKGHHVAGQLHPPWKPIELAFSYTTTNVQTKKDQKVIGIFFEKKKNDPKNLSWEHQTIPSRIVSHVRQWGSPAKNLPPFEFTTSHMAPFFRRGLWWLLSHLEEVQGT